MAEKKPAPRRKTSHRRTVWEVDGDAIAAGVDVAAAGAEAVAGAVAGRRDRRREADRRKDSLYAQVGAALRAIEDQHDIMFTRVKFKNRTSSAGSPLKMSRR